MTKCCAPHVGIQVDYYDQNVDLVFEGTTEDGYLHTHFIQEEYDVDDCLRSDKDYYRNWTLIRSVSESVHGHSILNMLD